MLDLDLKRMIEERAKASNIDLAKIDLEPEEFESGVGYAQITVIYDGLLQDEFYLRSLYAVNIADWMVEYERRTDTLMTDLHIDNADWTIHVYEYIAIVDDGEGEPYTGDLIYRVDS